MIFFRAALLVSPLLFGGEAASLPPNFHGKEGEGASGQDEVEGNYLRNQNRALGTTCTWSGQTVDVGEWVECTSWPSGCTWKWCKCMSSGSWGDCTNQDPSEDETPSNDWCPGNEDPEEWCKEKGGHGARPRWGQTCYNDWRVDCNCGDDYTETDNGCCHHDKDEFCHLLGGSNAIPKSGHTCYNEWYDCKCKSHCTRTSSGCSSCSSPHIYFCDGCSKAPWHFCKWKLGDGGVPKPWRTCYDTSSDCECDHGYTYSNGRCVSDWRSSSSAKTAKYEDFP